MSIQRAIVPPPDDTGYEVDFYAWLLGQIDAVRERNAENVDWPKLLEELGALGSSERRELVSRLATIVEHLLKYQYGLGREPAGGWHRTIRTQRRDLARHLSQSPSLRRLVPELAENDYPFVRDTVLDAFEGYEPMQVSHYDATLPTALPYTAEQILDPDFLPTPTVAR